MASPEVTYIVPVNPSKPDYAPFRVDVHPERDVVRVLPVGELDLATAPELAAQLLELRTAGFDRLVLDLRDVSFIDSTGIRVLVSEQRFAKAHDRAFSLVGGQPAVRRALEVCGLIGLLRTDSS